VYGGRNNAVIRRDSDPGKTFATQIERQMLHAWRLAFYHPVDGAWRQFEAALPEDMQTLLTRLRQPLDE
jgi:23S rRNA pseudouridine1911/1915/1917 synthase